MLTWENELVCPFVWLALAKKNISDSHILIPHATNFWVPCVCTKSVHLLRCAGGRFFFFLQLQTCDSFAHLGDTCTSHLDQPATLMPLIVVAIAVVVSQLLLLPALWPYTKSLTLPLSLCSLRLSFKCAKYLHKWFQSLDTGVGKLFGFSENYCIDKKK